MSELSLKVFSSRLAVFSSGERFPVLTHTETGQPVILPTRYVVDRRRGFRRASTIKRDVRVLGWFYVWAEMVGINLEYRLRTGPMLSAVEISGFAKYLRARRISNVVGSVFAERRGKENSTVLSPKVYNDYMDVIREFVLWAVDTQMAQVHNEARVEIERAKDMTVRAFTAERLAGDATRPQYALTDEELARLLIIVMPTDPANPFAKRVQHRNYALIRLLLETGLRRGEAAKLKVEDVVTVGASPYIKVVRREDDPDDKRRNEPAVKTLGRCIPITSDLTRILIAYLQQHRGRARHPFFFTSTKRSQPIWIGAIDDVFKRIRVKGFVCEDQLVPHTCRRTFCTRLKAVSIARGDVESDYDKIQNYLMGWTEHSQQGVAYTRRFVEAEAMERARLMQATLYTSEVQK